jgi:hypothetical protein
MAVSMPRLMVGEPTTTALDLKISVMMSFLSVLATLKSFTVWSPNRINQHGFGLPDQIGVIGRTSVRRILITVEFP